MLFGFRWVGRGAAALPFLLLLADAPACAGGKSLHLANRPDFIADDTIQKFEAETGIEVTYDLYQTNEELLKALRAGNKEGWDLVVAAAVPVLARAGAEHLLQPVQPDQLSNDANLDPEVLQAVAPYDPGNQLAVPYLWGTSGLAINVAALKAAMPDAPLDSLALIFDPALAERAAACGIAMANTPEDDLPAVLSYLGLDPSTEDEHALARAAELLAKLKPIVKRLPVNDFIDRLAAGKLCVGFGPSTVVSDAKSRAGEQDDGPDILYVIPKEHVRRWIDVLAIPANAADPDAARTFIDYVLRPEIISDITDWTGAANPNILAPDFVDEDDKSDETVFPSDASRPRLFLDKPRSPEAEKARAKLWARTGS
ncbi:MAG TPA: extracellular solute-binding protein [Aliidongia sp.]|nr:extracellular solute-binding protein [Aliidongia sp.]